MQSQVMQAPPADVNFEERFDLGPSYKSEFGESEIGRFQMKVDPLSADERRMSFSWRSPGLGLIASPTIYIDTSWNITAPATMTFAACTGPMVQQIDASDSNAVGAEAHRVGFAPKICFSGGDAFKKGISNLQISVNGSTISNSRINEYSATLDRVWVPDKLFQARFAQAGGLPNQADSVCVSGHAFSTLQAGRAPVVLAGGYAGVCAYTGDSGIQKRCENMLMQTKSLPRVDVAATGFDGVDVHDTKDRRVVRCRWAVNGTGLFSPYTPGDRKELAKSCPMRNSVKAIAHLNVVTIELLLKDLKECLFRNLMGRISDAGGLATTDSRGGFKISLSTQDPPALWVEYLRLSSARAQLIPASVNCSVFRNAVHDYTSEGDKENLIDLPAELTRTGVGALTKGMRAQGYSRANGTGRNASFADGSTREILWSGITTAQCPQYLAFLLQKSSDQYVLGGEETDDAYGMRITSVQVPAAGAAAVRDQLGSCQNYFLARNTDASASILKFSLEISSSVGSYRYSGDSFPYLRTRHELFRDCQRYACKDWCGQDIRRWQKHQGIVYLGASSFIRGLTTFATSFPLVINAKVVFGCEREYLDGTGACTVTPEAGPADCDIGPAVMRDMIFGRPIMICQYNKSALTISPSSAVLNSQNVPHSSAMAAVKAAVQQRAQSFI